MSLSKKERKKEVEISVSQQCTLFRGGDPQPGTSSEKSNLCIMPWSKEINAGV
jgi:hypothetical protein